MIFARYLYLFLGLVLLGVVIAHTDLGEVAAMTRTIGWGLGVIVALYFLSFVADVLAWQITLPSVPLNARWLYRLWKVRMVGEAANATIPAAGLGGEPLKAMLLQRHYGIDYRDGITSLVLSQTIITLSLVIFLASGFALMLGTGKLPASFNWIAGAGLVAFVAGVALVIGAQHIGLSDRIRKWLSHRPIGRRLDAALAHVGEIEMRLVTFYGRRRRRFVGALIAAFIPWLIGVPEIYFTTLFLGHPITLTDAWIVEAAVQLIRAGAFFLPAGLGAQEGVFLFFFSAMVGMPSLGAAVAIVRRMREILWIAWGFALGARFEHQRPAAG
jgi:uncharacterized protein (TIRG00374 family)